MNVSETCECFDYLTCLESGQQLRGNTTRCLDPRSLWQITADVIVRVFEKGKSGTVL